MSIYRIHERLPSGFTYANNLQIETFEASGSVDGAAKVVLVADAGELPRLAFRARPPRALHNVQSSLGRASVSTVEDYRAEYEKGWRAASRTTDFPSGTGAHDDGYLDRASGRAKWHLTYCADHDECGEG